MNQMTHVSSTMTLKRWVAGVSPIFAPALRLLDDLIESRPTEARRSATVMQPAST
jgi:hypothetical protein